MSTNTPDYDQALKDAVEVIEFAREEGEGDLRQVREWIRALTQN